MTANGGRSGDTFLFPPSFFASTADASKSNENKLTHVADMFPARSNLPPPSLSMVTQSMLSVPEDTNDEETKRLREENARLK